MSRLRCKARSQFPQTCFLPTGKLELERATHLKATCLPHFTFACCLFLSPPPRHEAASGSHLQYRTIWHGESASGSGVRSPRPKDKNPHKATVPSCSDNHATPRPTWAEGWYHRQHRVPHPPPERAPDHPSVCPFIYRTFKPQGGSQCNLSTSVPQRGFTFFTKQINLYNEALSLSAVESKQTRLGGLA